MRSHFIEYAEFSFQKAQLAVDYLYNDGSFQSYCDCDNSIKHEIRCNNCGTYFENDYDLAQIVDIDDGELINGCPECQTDSYLMDLIEYA